MKKSQNGTAIGISNLITVVVWLPTLGMPQTVTHQAPLSMGFSRQEY